MRAAGVGPPSATLNGFASLKAAASILMALAPAPDNATHAAAPSSRSAAAATAGSDVRLHSIGTAIAAYTCSAMRLVIIISSHGLFFEVLAGCRATVNPS